MKVSVSLPAEDVEFLDSYAESRGIASRSAVVHKAVRLLKASGLEAAYEQAWDEWDQGDAELWKTTSTDGLG
jgi:Arc/MetJ-type ribon-helix-helix transcriptional regulator